MSKGFVLRLPEDLKEEAAKMAARYFQARAKRSPGRRKALELFEGMGADGPPRAGDEV